MQPILERILALQQRLVPDEMRQGSDLPEEAVNELRDILFAADFLNLEIDDQFSFLDFVQKVYERTYHSSAPRCAEAVERAFQAHLRNNAAPLRRLCKTYDFLYFLYWCAAVSIEQQRGFDAGVVIPFSRYLAKRFGPAEPIAQRCTNRPVRLCYLAQFAYDGAGNALALVADTLLASLSEHYPGEYELFLYAWMHKTPEFLERIKSLGVTVRTFDLREFSREELSRMRSSLLDDQFDVVMTDMNSAVPQYLFERRVAPVQIFYQLGMPFWRAENVDAVFQGWQIAPQTLGVEANKCYAVPAPKSTRSINPSIDPARVRAERNRFPESKFTIGFYGRLVKITPEYCEILRRILELHPETIVVLGGTGNACPIREFINANGLEQRLFVADEFVDGHVWGRFLDIFLDTFPLTGGYSCREVLAKGKPIVHLLSEDMPNLNQFLDPELQAAHADEYVAHLSRLLSDGAAYRQASRRAFEISRKDADTRPFASTFHLALRDVIDRAAAANLLTESAETTESPLMNSIG